MKEISLRDLIEATVHIGHIKSRWVPAMAPYIWGEKNNIHLIDISKTVRQLNKAAAFLESTASKGQPILWVGTKKAAQNIIESHAIALKCPYVTHRWIGGSLTNFSQVKKSVTKLLHYEDIVAKADEYLYTKKEINRFNKLAERLGKNVGGIRKLTWPIGAIIIVDVKKEQAAVREAMKAGIPIIAMVDTNSDPTGIDYVIPSNDDASRSIAVIIDFLAQAVQRGQAAEKMAEKKKEAEKAEAAAEGKIEEPEELEIDEDEQAPVKESKKILTKKRPLKKDLEDGEEVPDKKKSAKKPEKGAVGRTKENSRKKAEK